MENLLPSNIQELSIVERLQLVQDIWDSITISPDLVPLIEGQKQELDNRLKEYDKNPHTGKSWEEVKKKFRDY